MAPGERGGKEMKKEDTELGLYAKYLFIGKWLMQESMYV